jgi:hypothetical protein
VAAAVAAAAAATTITTTLFLDFNLTLRLENRSSLGISFANYLGA